MKNKSYTYSLIVSSMLIALLHPMVILDKKVFGIFHDDYEQSNKFGKYYIQKFDSDGNFVTSWGVKGTGEGDFLHPHGIAVDSKDSVYVNDEDHGNIQKFTMNGKFIKSWGEVGSKEGQFKEPHGMAFDSKDNLYVTDTQNHRIQVFTSDGEYIKNIGKKGTGPGEFLLVHDIAIDDKDNIYVADSRDAHPNKVRVN
jgi:tripartite motif-containing protein 71